jgi:hypothetical protein
MCGYTNTTKSNSSRFLDFSCNHNYCFKCSLKASLSNLGVIYSKLEMGEPITLNCIVCGIGICTTDKKSILNLLKNTEAQKYTKSVTCKTHVNKAEYYCKDCKWIMCSTCLILHKSITEFSEHNLTENVCEAYYNQNLCLIHKKEKIIYICQKCNLPVCIVCLNTTHREHDKSNIIEFNENKRQVARNIKLPFINFDEYCSYSDLEEKNFREELGKISSSMVDQIQNTINTLENLKKEFLEKICQIEEGYSENTELQKILFNKIYKDIKNLSVVDTWTIQYLSKIEEVKFPLKIHFKMDENFISQINKLKEISGKIKIPKNNLINLQKIEVSDLSRFSKINFTTIISLDNDKIAIGSSDGCIRIWHQDDFLKCLFSFLAHSMKINSLLLLSLNKLASASDDCYIKIWRIEDLKATCINSIVLVSPIKILKSINHEYFFSCSGNNLQLWKNSDLKSFVSISSLAQTNIIYFVKDRRHILTETSDKMISFWEYSYIDEISTGDENTNILIDKNFKKLKFYQGHSWKLNCCVEFDTKVCLGCSDGVIRIYTIKGENISNLKSHKSSITSLFFDGKDTLLSACDDKIINIWTLENTLNYFKCTKTITICTYHLNSLLKLEDNSIIVACQGISIIFKLKDLYKYYDYLLDM